MRQRRELVPARKPSRVGRLRRRVTAVLEKWPSPTEPGLQARFGLSTYKGFAKRMIIETEKTDFLTTYRALIGVVGPRPIAWVTTVDEQSRVNLAPFSFFNTFGGHPPVVVFSPNRKRDGGKKDTLLNVEATREFVINAAVAELSEQVNLSSKEIPHGESEVDLAGLSLLPSQRVKPPRLRNSPVHLECVLSQVLQIGEGVTSANLVIGQIVLMHIDDAILDARGQVDPRKLRTIGRLGGNHYCRTTDLFEMQRP
jgi:flavin reductase (DIM6/NTAB) family NADH-FMN oxidoreductase RutF